MGREPIVSAMFANSSLSGGANGFVSRPDARLGRQVDPDRPACCPSCSNPTSAIGATSSGRWTCPCSSSCATASIGPRTALTFRQFMREGTGRGPGDARRLRPPPDDAVSRTCASRTSSRCAARTPFRRASPARCRPCGRACSTTGAHSPPPGGWWSEAPRRSAKRRAKTRRAAVWLPTYAGRPVLALARDVAAIAGEGLRRIGHAGRRDADECVLPRRRFSSSSSRA